MGLDVGTTSTQMIVSRLRIENRASEFAVPDLVIADREILYESPVHFTPLRSEALVDGEALRTLLLEEYRHAGLTRETVDTGAVIVTGETSRKENAREVAQALSGLAGDFVVATAGPDLESELAARGSGAVAYSAETGKTVLHMDIGGGTANLCLIRGGEIAATGCLNVGGRLLKLDKMGSVTYVSPVLGGLWGLSPGSRPSQADIDALCARLVQALEAAAGLTQADALLRQLTTEGTRPLPLNAPGEGITLSFSGGVADCIEKQLPWLEFGDLGPVLGQAIRESRLCRGDYMLGSETIRATVIGAGCHSAQLSGSTVFYQNVPFPLKNVPVVPLGGLSRESVRRALETQEEGAVLSFAGRKAPGYREVAAMAETLAESTGGSVRICMEEDMAKALGQALALRLGPRAEILCIDRVRVPEGSYLDVGAPVGPALPVVVKTLVLGG